MLKGRRLLVALALVALAGAIVYVVVPNDKKAEEWEEVYVSKEAIPQGEAFKDLYFTTKEVLKPEPWMITDLDQIKGMTAVRTIGSGRFIDKDDFSEDKNDVLLKQGEGEYTIRVKAENVNGGRLKPGDTVNVLYVALPQGGAVKEDPLEGSGRTIVNDLMVLSVRTQYAKDVEEDQRDDVTNVPAAVTLKVSAAQSEELAWYQEHGTLSIYVKGKGEAAASE